MKKIKAIVKIFTLATVITLLMITTVFAEDKVENGELTGFDVESTSYTTPDDVTAIVRNLDSRFWGPNIITLNIGKGVKEVGHFTFYYSYDETPKLETVNMEDVEIIGDFAFGGWKYLKTVNTSSELKEIKSAAFTNLLALKSIDLQNLERLGNQAFEGAGLVEVTVPGTVKKVEFQAFNLMPNLEKVTVEEGVEELEKYSFQSYKFKEIHLPASLTKIDDFAISGNKGGLTIYAPAGSYAEKWAKSKGFTVNGSGTTTPTIPVVTPTQPTQPTVPTVPTVVPAMDSTNYTNKEVILATPRGLGATKGALKVEKENLVFDDEYGEFKKGTYDVETWGPDTYATWKYGNAEGFSISTSYYLKINGKLYLGNAETGSAHSTLRGLVGGNENNGEYIEAGILKMHPTYKVWKEDPANPFVIPKERWTEKNVGEVYVVIHVYYSSNEYTIGSKKGTIVDSKIFWTTRMVKLDMSGKGTTPTTPTVETVTALPTTSPILVNGKRVEFEAYNINGNNYFKLRDIALAVNTTSKQFGVNWDAVKNAINLTSGSGYSSVGGELAKGDGITKYGTATTSQIYKDGELLTISGYNINNNNYFKLRDLGKAFNIEIDWDNEAQTVVIDTTRSYTED